MRRKLPSDEATKVVRWQWAAGGELVPAPGEEERIHSEKTRLHEETAAINQELTHLRQVVEAANSLRSI